MINMSSDDEIDFGMKALACHATYLKDPYSDVPNLSKQYLSYFLISASY